MNQRLRDIFSCLKIIENEKAERGDTEDHGRSMHECQDGGYPDQDTPSLPDASEKEDQASPQKKKKGRRCLKQSNLRKDAQFLTKVLHCLEDVDQRVDVGHAGGNDLELGPFHPYAHLEAACPRTLRSNRVFQMTQAQPLQPVPANTAPYQASTSLLHRCAGFQMPALRVALQLPACL